ncbi:thiamine phosphate synthase [Paenibacillus sp. MER 99-2]|uniref:thiamine phosphate synthase n=1 Tax=Paenibacillus sp. MER 99-2 TaxID=2939572 RepID=UPI00203B0F02|nr:thiamine phosphate synthase [Paenibacillus sp. MER 99-2]MCM3171705.1 thiamine phosphate synthase [Paenibacillus sp. MER 99-2]
MVITEEHDSNVTASFELHVISQGVGNLHNFVSVSKDIWPWVDYIHIREKQQPPKQRREWTNQLHQSGVPSDRIVINGVHEVGQGEGLAGVHWGQEDFSKSALSISDIRKRIRIGVSVHSVAEAKAAEQRGVDYVFFGHIYDSNSKPDIQPRGLKQLAEVCTNVTIPVIAIGGIGVEHVRDLRRAGARGIAVISHIWASENPKHAIRVLRQAIVESEG